MTDSEIPVCPDQECDHAGIQIASTCGRGTTWWCEECDATFSEPRYRLTRSDAGAGLGPADDSLAAALLAADPGEVAADE